MIVVGQPYPFPYPDAYPGPRVFRASSVVFERDGPGVVYDSLGLDGSRAKLLRRFDAAHWHDQLRLRRPDLLVLHYGTNESQFAGLSATRYRDDLTETVGHLRADAESRARTISRS